MIDEQVKTYFANKRAALLSSVEAYMGKMECMGVDTVEEMNERPDWETLKRFAPRRCNDRESWQGRRCQGFCPVAGTCRKIEKGE